MLETLSCGIYVDFVESAAGMRRDAVTTTSVDEALRGLKLNDEDVGEVKIE